MRSITAIVLRARAPILLLMVLAGCSVLRPDPSATSTPTSGGVITIGVVGPAAMDPAVAQGSALMVLKAACDTIARIDADEGDPQPGLGRWDFSENSDGLRLELKSARFADGETVDSESVISTLRRTLSPATGSPWASLLGSLEGVEEFRNGAAPSISGLTRSQDGSLRIQLTRPYSEIVSALSHPSFAPLSDNALAQAADAGAPVQPVCSGPFEVQAGAGEGDVRLKRRASYGGDDPALADVIVVKSFESDQLAFEAFTKGAVDMAPLPFNEAAKPDRPGTKLSSPDLTVMQLMFDVSRPEFADPRLRHALSLAFDRLAVIDAAFGDGRPAATRWLTTTLDGDSRDSKCPAFAKKIADPEKAQQIRDSAGIAPGLQIPIFFDRERTDRLIPQALQVQAKDALGIDLMPTPLDPPQFEASLNARQDLGAWLASTNPPLPGGDFQLGSLFESGSSGNYTRFSNEAFDRSVADARAAVAPNQRSSGYRQAEETVCEAMPAIPLWRGIRNWVFNPNKVKFEGEEFDASGELLLRHMYGS